MRLKGELFNLTTILFRQDPQGTSALIRQYVGDGQSHLPKNNFADKPKVIDAAHLFKPPHRASRPDHFVIILRGLPGTLLADLVSEYHNLFIVNSLCG
jgi:YLP motif-containing protein 1